MEVTLEAVMIVEAMMEAVMTTAGATEQAIAVAVMEVTGN